MGNSLLNHRLSLSLCDADLFLIDELSDRLGVKKPAAGSARVNRSATVRSALGFVEPLLDVLDTIPLPAAFADVPVEICYTYRLGVLLDRFDVDNALRTKELAERA